MSNKIDWRDGYKNNAIQDSVTAAIASLRKVQNAFHEAVLSDPLERDSRHSEAWALTQEELQEVARRFVHFLPDRP